MNLSITELKKGTLIQIDNVPYRIIEYAQKVMGRGGSIVNIKIKSLLDGRVLEKTFKGNDSLQAAEVTNANVQFLYSTNDKAYFMDTTTYETHEIPLSIVGEQAKYLTEGFEVTAQEFNKKMINIELPKNIYLKVIHAEDAVKGNTSSAITKDAELQTGAIIKVPAFIKTGDIVSVDTTTGNYRERKKD